MPALTQRKAQRAREEAGDRGSSLVAGNLRVDLAAYRASVGGRYIPLTYQEFELLRHLIAQRDRIVPFEELMQGLWHADVPDSRRRLGVVVCRLRAKLAGAEPYHIETIRGRGYGLMIPSPAVEEPTR